MKRTLVEVFIEKTCRSSKSVLSTINANEKRLNLEIKVYDFEHDRRAFAERQVIIIPATFVDHRLAFYGDFSSRALQVHISGHTTMINGTFPTAEGGVVQANNPVKRSIVQSHTLCSFDFRQSMKRRA